MKKEPKPKLKLIVRQLPAQLTEDAFLSEIASFRQVIDFFYYVQGSIREKRVTDSRAYLGFPKEEALMAFTQFFDGHLFVTSKGREMRAQVEYAPFQKTPNRNKKRYDKYQNTIESDPDFLQFCEELKNPIQLLPSAEEQLDRRLAEGKENEQPQTTPLLEYLKQKKANKVRGDRAERRKRAKKEMKGGASKDKKLEEKKKRERTLRKKEKEKEERRRKKKDIAEGGVESGPGGNAKDKKKKKSDGQDEAKRGKNGLWVVRQQLEPGAISIQTRETSTSGEQQSPTRPEKPSVGTGRGATYQGRNPYGGRGGRQKDAGERAPHHHPNNRGNKGGGGGGASRRGGYAEQGRVKIYAPKQAQTPSAVTVNNGP